MNNFQRIIIVLAMMVFCIALSLNVERVQGQIDPEPTDERPIYTYFPDSMVCDQALKGDGPSIGLVTIGKTTLQEVESAYSPYFDVSIEYSEASGETLIYFRFPVDGSIYQRIDVCVIDDIIVMANNDFPSVAQMQQVQRETAVPHPPVIPVSFEYLGIKHFIAKYGLPDVIAYSTLPSERMAFWFEQGVAGEFYTVDDLSFTPSSFGAVGRNFYFPFQAASGYENRWPYNQTLPEEDFIAEIAPFLATDVPTVRNPFDYDSIIATLTTVPYPALTATPSPTP